MKEKPHPENYIYRYLLYLNYIFIIFLGLSYLSIYINPVNFWAISIFGMAYPVLIITNLLFVFLWIGLRKNYFFISFIAIFIGINLIGKFVQFSFVGKQNSPIESISLLSYNVHNFSQKSKEGVFDKGIQHEIFNFIESQNSDIVCLQEFNYIGENIYASHAQLKQQLGSNNYYFESYFNPKKNKVFGMATFSKFPIMNSGYLDLEETRKFGTYIDIIRTDDTIRVYNIHLESISLNYVDYSFVSGISAGDSIQKPNTRLLLNKLHKALINRTRQVVVLKNHLSLSPYPVILCGDFNELSCSYNYRNLSAGMHDAFVESGNGIGKTFASFLPAFRIDYILFDPQFKSFDYEEIKINLSDHYPIKNKLYLK